MLAEQIKTEIQKLEGPMVSAGCRPSRFCRGTASPGVHIRVAYLTGKLTPRN